MNRLFMTADLQAKFGAINELLKRVLIAAGIDGQTPDPQLKKEMGGDLAKIDPLLPRSKMQSKCASITRKRKGEGDKHELVVRV